MRAPIIAASVFLLIAPPAFAAPTHHRAAQAAKGWQYARWGMTSAEVQAASHGQATQIASEPIGDLTTGAAGSYSAGKYTFVTKFEFKDAGLWAVDLDLRDPTEAKCISLSADLEGKYGKPSEDQTGISDIFSWRDDKSGSQIVFIDLGKGQSCTLNYRALITRNADGL